MAAGPCINLTPCINILLQALCFWAMGTMQDPLGLIICRWAVSGTDPSTSHHPQPISTTGHLVPPPPPCLRPSGDCGWRPVEGTEQIPSRGPGAGGWVSSLMVPLALLHDALGILPKKLFHPHPLVGGLIREFLFYLHFGF